MYRKSAAAGRTRQYPKAPGYDSHVQSSPTANQSSQPQQWTGQQQPWQANTQPYVDSNQYYNPASAHQQYSSANQYPQIMNQPSLVQKNPEQSSNADPWNWDWDIGGSSDNTPNSQPEQRNDNWNAGWDWNVPENEIESKDQTQYQNQQLTTPSSNQNSYANHYSEQNVVPTNNFQTTTVQQHVQHQPDLYSQGGYYENVSSQPNQDAANYQYQQPLMAPIEHPQMQYSVADNMNTSYNENQYSNTNNDVQADVTQNTAFHEHMNPMTAGTTSHEVIASPATSVHGNSDLGNQGFDVVDRAQNVENYNANIIQNVTDEMSEINLNDNEGNVKQAIGGSDKLPHMPVNNSEMNSGAFQMMAMPENVIPLTSEEILPNAAISDGDQNSRTDTQTAPIQPNVNESQTPQNFFHSSHNSNFSDHQTAGSQMPDFAVSNDGSGHHEERILESDKLAGKFCDENLVTNEMFDTHTLLDNKAASQQLYNQVEVVNNGNAKNISCEQASHKTPDGIAGPVEEVENHEVLLNGSTEHTAVADYPNAEIKSQEQFYEQKEKPHEVTLPAKQPISPITPATAIQSRIDSPFQPIYRSTPDAGKEEQVKLSNANAPAPKYEISAENLDQRPIPDNLEKLHDADANAMGKGLPTEPVKRMSTGSHPSVSSSPALWENPDIVGNVKLAPPSPNRTSQSPSNIRQNAVIVPSLSDHQEVLDNPLGFSNKPGNSFRYPADIPNPGSTSEHVAESNDINPSNELPVLPENTAPVEASAHPIETEGRQSKDFNDKPVDGISSIPADQIRGVDSQGPDQKMETENRNHQFSHDNEQRNADDDRKYSENDRYYRDDDRKYREDDRKYRDDDRQYRAEDEKYPREGDRRSRYDYDRLPNERHGDRRYDGRDDRRLRDERDRRARDLSSTRYDDDDSYDRSAYRYDDRRRDHSRSRYDEEWRYRDSSRSRYDGRYSRDHSPSPYGRQSRDHSRSRYNDYYNKDPSRTREDYYGDKHQDHSQSRDRPPSRQNYDDSYRNYDYDADRRQRDYRRSDDYYRDRSGYGDQYDRMARERDYLYRKMYYDNYRMGGMGVYNYGYFDELYNTNPSYREKIEKYRQYYNKQQGYTTNEYDRTSVQSSGRNSVTNELRRNESFTQEYQQPQPENILPYNLSSIHPDPSQNYGAYTDAYNVAGEKLAPAEPVAREPPKFTSPHVVATFSNCGRLVKVLGNDPRSGAPPTVEILETKPLFENEDLAPFPGPLVVGETHKNDVIQFCKSKLQALQKDMSIADRESASLIWEYLILMIRQNGSVAGTDIADLLLKDHLISSTNDKAAKPDVASPDEGIFDSASSTASSSQKNTPDEQDHVPSLPLQVSKVVDKFREYLLFGHKKDALDWAIKNGLWGHALFLASKMDKRTHAMIMMKFANSLQLNDPLQTLYQLMSGRQPASVTCVADEKWGDWRQHLAMILSNATNKVDVDRKSIKTLGDTLASRGCLHAAHFCYLMVGSNFGSYATKSSKLVLIGSSHQEDFKTFATNEAIQCTEIYEFAQKLSQPAFALQNFQQFKFLYATRLYESGYIEEALHYCEVISGEIMKTPAVFSPELIAHLHEMASKLKFNDPHYTHNEGDMYDLSDPQWILKLGSINQSFKDGTIQHIEETEVSDSMSSLPTNEYEAGENQNNLANNQYASNSQNVAYQTNYHGYGSEQLAAADAEQNEQYGQSQLEVQQPEVAENHVSSGQAYHQGYGNADLNAQNNQVTNGQDMYAYQGYGQQQWNQQDSYAAYPDQGHLQNNVEDAALSPPQNVSDPSAMPSSYDYYGATTATTATPSHEPVERRQSNTSTSSYGRIRRDSHRSNASSDHQKNEIRTPAAPTNKKPDQPKMKPNANKGGLFSGLFQKLSFLPKNQMILPDDKDPVIVWDDATQKWVNKDGDDDDIVNAPAAPPSDFDLSATNPSIRPLPSSAAPLPAAKPANAQQANGPIGNNPNRFHRPKNKSMRANYVDVFGNKSQQSSGSATAAGQSLPTSLITENNNVQQSAPSFFVPAPVSSSEPVDFLSKNTMNMAENPELEASKNSNSAANPTLSRSSSQSSLSREVQSYMIPNSKPGMQMFNPSDFPSQQPSLNSSQPRLGRAGPRAYPR